MSQKGTPLSAACAAGVTDLCHPVQLSKMSPIRTPALERLLGPGPSCLPVLCLGNLSHLSAQWMPTLKTLLKCTLQQGAPDCCGHRPILPGIPPGPGESQHCPRHRGFQWVIFFSFLCWGRFSPLFMDVFPSQCSPAFSVSTQRGCVERFFIVLPPVHQA